VSTIDEAAGKLLERERVGVLATTTAAGRPRQSLVYFARDGDRLLISTEPGRLKARDVERTGWASIAVRTDEQPYPSATFSGPARILTEDIGRPTALVMQRISGAEEAPPAQSDADLAAVNRVILAIDVERVTGATYLDQL
jgi:PPOX class probable F420-dependent enzyme